MASSFILLVSVLPVVFLFITISNTSHLPAPLPPPSVSLVPPSLTLEPGWMSTRRHVHPQHRSRPCCSVQETLRLSAGGWQTKWPFSSLRGDSPSAATSCHLLPPPATSCHLLPPPATSCHLLPPPATSCHLLPPPASRLLTQLEQR